VDAAHATGFIEMGKGTLESLTTEAQQLLAAWATDASPIPVIGIAGVAVFPPVPSSAIRFGDIVPDAHGFEIHERLVAVIALVADNLLNVIAIGPHGLDVLRRVD
jgi:hypothetical protein